MFSIYVLLAVFVLLFVVALAARISERWGLYLCCVGAMTYMMVRFVFA